MGNIIDTLHEKKKETIEEIYSKIFCRFKEQYIIVFLCGGASAKDRKSLRDKIRPLLEKKRKGIIRNQSIKVFYPEDLLIDMLNKTKDADLLSYEQLLADNSHIIVIICESAGSLVELGAFSNNNYTVNKVIAAVEKRRIKDKSFIMLGPIKYLKKKNRLNVVEYSNNEEELANKLLKNIREKYNNRTNKEVRLNTIIGMHYFILLLLYYYKQINSKELTNMIKHIMKKDGMETKDFDVIFIASIKLLFLDKQIIKQTDQKYTIYELTNKGYKTIKKMIEYCTGHQTYDRIRINIMYSDFYKSSHS